MGKGGGSSSPGKKGKGGGTGSGMDGAMVAEILHIFSTLLAEHVKMGPRKPETEPGVMSLGIQIGLPAPPAKVVAHEHCSCLKDRLQLFADPKSSGLPEEAAGLAQTILKVVY